MSEIDNLTETMKSMLAKDQDITTLINDFNEISNSFGKPTKSGVHGSSNIAKALKDGNKISSIPLGLEAFTNYIQHADNYKWIKWQQEGKNYLDISTDCPYCTHDIQENKNTILKVSEAYDPKTIENLNKIVAVFQRLNKYFSEETNKIIDSFLKNVSGYTDEQISFLKEVKEQIDRLNSNFQKAQNLGFTSLKDVEKIIEELKNYKIDINLYIYLNSPSTKEKTDIVNNAIDALEKKAGELQGSITKQKKLIEKLIKQNSKEINDFLKNAGYSYNVKLIEDEKSSYKLKLIHNDAGNEINNVKSHLSYGERNAFSLVLFMYDALKSNPELIILDDPISSFDKNKKYAIIEMLFRREPSFRGKTVLLLTHDFEPIVDMVLHHSDRFQKPHATFIENNHGQLTEKEVTRADIKTYIDINLENIQLNLHEINRLVYLRRYQEIEKQKGFGFDIISNLFHKRETPTLRDGDLIRAMTAKEIADGTTEVTKLIPSFNYEELLIFVNSKENMKALYTASSNNYEKLHLYRMIFDDQDDGIDSDVIRKFINEAFHIENNYIYQLNPCDFQLVPQYVIDECDKHIAEQAL
jgi:ABC-type lipoprotein export system ATPase subunit